MVMKGDSKWGRGDNGREGGKRAEEIEGQHRH